MNTQIAEAPPASSSASAAKPLPTAKEAGLTSIADAFAAASKTPAIEPKPAVAPEVPEAKEKPVAAKPALLESLSESEKPAVESKDPKPGTKEWDIKKSADWKAAVKAKEDAVAEADKLRKQLDEAQNWKKELEILKPKADRADEYALKLHEVAFEKSDEFQRIVTAQNEIVSAAKTLAKEYDLADDTVEKAMMLKGKRRLDFLEETFGNPTAAGKFDRILDEYDAKEGQKLAEVKRSRETSEKMDATQRELALNEQARAKTQILEAFDASISKFESHLPGYFKKKEGDDAHNTMVDEVLSTCREIIQTDDPEMQAEAAGLAGIARALIKRMPELQKENAALRKRLEQYTSNEPRITGGSENETNGNGERVGMMDRWKQGVR